MNENDQSIVNVRGVENWDQAAQWLKERRIEDVECITPDLAGIPRGKMMPSSKFTSNIPLTVPSAIYRHTISGESMRSPSHEKDGDLRLSPDLSTLSVVPWEIDPTAQIVCDVVDYDCEEVTYTPRNVLKRVLNFYAKNGLKPIIAPEIEFYLIAKNEDPDYPLHPPKGRSGRSILGGQSYSIMGINEFDEVIDDIWKFSEKQGLEIDTLIHEEGPAQFEINIRHGDPLKLADQVFLFKRTIREAAFKHDIYATFMAKPMQNYPGSAMHIHQSVLDIKSNKNIFSNPDGSETDLFRYFIGGLQQYIPNALVMLAPYVNSYRRMVLDMGCPVNNAWGYDNRTTAFRIPFSDANTKRIENRLPSSDTNPYLVLAASLACGLLGILQKIEPTPPTTKSANLEAINLPRGLLEAVTLLENTSDFRDIFGSQFIDIYTTLKRNEFETFMQVISPWEREFLLLNV
ncbi:glutamine synthetase [Candidatus Liberibacter africanus]|uniref:Putative glutamine synthetase n=1 Tax=Candidatus Liberibacter africanus PTSAPSY TaxID=1277257 RepID=A0A0G3I9F9_LIBAF|nr:glutamine synthetase family protein [Candidatus Liberibacter africanus]AKK20392.1 putative glutamine synthetase [Candidatus Liberibacter africanus PTSAPSY]QTP64127.1 glutamine synthetase [Candidatus Liberibacter africanus]